jgi:hypothetical protein
MEKWSKWINLTKENLKKVPEESGIYKISYPKKINRLKGSDKDGILMIGMSSNLRKRINEFFLDIKKKGEPKSFYHSEGYRFWVLKLEEYFPIEKLRFKFMVTKNNKKTEEDELVKYQDRYLELPPLNNFGGR